MKYTLRPLICSSFVQEGPLSEARMALETGGGSIVKLLTRSSKTSNDTKSLVFSGSHFVSVPDSVDDILCRRMSFGL